MAVDSIGRVANPNAGLNQAAVGLEDFLDIFLAQLNFQDPLEPVDNREFIAQLAQFSALELANRTSDNVEGLLEVNSVDQAVGLLGREVNIRGDNGLVVAEVIAIRLQGSQPVLSVRTAEEQILDGISPAQVSVIR
ncbi:flagellar hook assembly protein FlgD [Ketobacter alkanivorans]|uniref:Basal-body rod modification protein FlgD n=1 Tax=Ketobacter alkanivorans TaxID=1917421 RepID=A0A2K9LKS2_9GAMM|nr:flagellar hook capping FlgD N-terminal domain-containing protein [Ketobacter alkanivorans]AUM12956.1 flagellar hook capping protein [Ketobacter alkanivorans]